MVKAYFRVTFETVTAESAEQGDFEDSGFAAPHGWKFPVSDPGPHEMTLREAIDTAGGPFDNSGRYWSTVDAQQDYSSGESTFYNIHPPSHITPASYKRVSRLLGTARKPMSAAQRAAVSKRMKAAWRRRKAAAGDSKRGAK
jgi:hypothetical protein